MNYRSFGKKIDFAVSALGFGAMRLPTNADKTIDRAESIKMIRTAVDEGVNYIDTAYPYHGGDSEVLVGEALRDGYRQKVALATKLPVWHVKSADDFDKYLDEQLKKLDTDIIDFYLLHALGSDRWDSTVVRFDLLTKAEKALKAGKIAHLGFSFHDDHDAFIKIVDGYDKWEFCQVQFNYLDVNNQAGLKGIEYAAQKGLGVIVMEPLLGGKLARPAKRIMDIFETAVPGRSAVEWALDYIWNIPQISLLLSGMSTMQQVTDNLEYAARAEVGMFSESENAAIEAVQKAFKDIKAVPCTGCEYCLPCPNGVDIPRNFGMYNNCFMYDDLDSAKNSYASLAKRSENKKIAANCIQCCECESKCPQQIEISKMLPKVAELLG